MFSPVEIIAKKRDGHSLSEDEIKWFINSAIEEKIPSYQMSAFLMATFFQGMTTAETAALTNAMLYSGEVLEFEDPKTIDKHSTGGVGDKASFILAPIACAAGVTVPMIAGRGLGHTGGTVDKIESVKGFRTGLSSDEFKSLLATEKIVLMGQTGSIAPADKQIYALRDVTATIESIPLITASIMSKKLAEGARGIVMDIKYGEGAFMVKKSSAKQLAKSLAATANRFNRDMFVILSDMNQPLGKAIGNSLEIIESVETLKNNGPKDLTDLSLSLAGAMIFLAGISKTHAAGIKKAKEVLKNGTALTVFKRMIAAQGGCTKFIENYDELLIASCKSDILSPKEGYIKSLPCKELGLDCVQLGGGRMKANQPIDHGVGIVLHKKVGDKVKKDEALMTIYHNKGQEEIVAKIGARILATDLKLSKNKLEKLKPLIGETLHFPAK